MKTIRKKIVVKPTAKEAGMYCLECCTNLSTQKTVRYNSVGKQYHTSWLRRYTTPYLPMFYVILSEYTPSSLLFIPTFAYSLKTRFSLFTMFEASISNESLEQLPTAAFNGEIVLVDDIDQLDDAVAYLGSQKVLGFDTETRPSFKKGGKNQVALLQLAGKDRAYLIRLNNIGLPQPLADILESDSILKIGAAIRDDINALNKCAKFHARGFIDLQKFIDNYEIQEKSVKKMAAIILNVRISKSQQLSNWDSEKYTDAQKLYAATDAWVCREMYLALLQHRSKGAGKRGKLFG